jgi:hypothetical protein
MIPRRVNPKAPNAGRQLLPEAGAQRTLEAVSCTPLLGASSVAAVCYRSRPIGNVATTLLGSGRKDQPCRCQRLQGGEDWASLPAKFASS